MGYRKEPTVYKLKFENYDGLEVTVKSLSVEEFLNLSSMAATVSADDPSAAIEQSNDLLKKFASSLVSWNLEDENGKPVPATFKGIGSQEFSFILEIITEWMSAIANVSPNLEQKSSSTPSLEQLPMAMQ